MHIAYIMFVSSGVAWAINKEHSQYSEKHLIRIYAVLLSRCVALDSSCC